MSFMKIVGLSFFSGIMGFSQFVQSQKTVVTDWHELNDLIVQQRAQFITDLTINGIGTRGNTSFSLADICSSNVEYIGYRNQFADRVINQGLKNFTNLTKLSLVNLPALTVLDLSAQSKLRVLHLKRLSNLKVLDIGSLVNLNSLILIRLLRLKKLNLDSQINLNTLILVGLPRLASLELSRLSKLTFVFAFGLPALTLLDLSGLIKLERVILNKFYSLQELRLGALDNLCELDLKDMPCLATLDFSLLVNLKKLTLGCMNNLQMSAEQWPIILKDSCVLTHNNCPLLSPTGSGGALVVEV